MELDPLLLSRLQFAFVVSFHAIFPVFTIGLASYIAVLHALFYKTRNPAWDRLAQLWTKVFAVAFGMGVVSGIVMSFQFGTNWSNFAQSTANFMGPMLSYEVVTAFFLEAAFLGVLLFGRGRVPQGVHLFAAIMVAVGTFISTFWILAANSWMHTPAGVEVVNGVFRVTSWTEAIFNPSFPFRLAHMAMASFITGGFVVAGVSAWYLLIGRDVEANRKALSMCLWMLLVLTPTQALVGDFHGLNTLEYQPTKLAAMEGNWETREGAPFLLFAWPDQEAQQNRFEIGIPYMASLILTHELHGEVPGILEASPEEQPPVALVFWAFRVMVGIGFLMIAVSLVGLYLRRGGRIYHSHRFLQTLRLMSVMPFVAVLAGWITTESGRAPWLVYGIMTHADGVTPSLTGGMALFTLIGYVLVYGVIFYAGTYYLTRVIRYGMQEKDEEKLVDDFETPKRPWSATGTPFDDDPTKVEG
ncbi:cytochrome ubiquinol oxidase subunit I [Billgrantia endophytica]|uniref:Cytochrome ubiquinol oxidase subunit I n=1 Tax=Billgrantia endophytica TaxID=2033802 RepID=A0A2N7U3C7_9GAMM|nr:cytochrome ubiquinol oxidase subunit I [Halomonas endophytica]PMR74913.1 cytochrome ubiquinol oxidase subunit I [Halomonas endophytica]